MLSLDILLLKPGMEPLVMREWCLPVLVVFLLLSLPMVEADGAPTNLLESRFGPRDRLPQSSRVRVGPRDGERLLRGGSSSTTQLQVPQVFLTLRMTCVSLTQSS